MRTSIPGDNPFSPALAAEPDYPLWLPLPKGAPPLVMLFRRIPAGTFRMGSRGYNDPEEPMHSVAVGEFWLGKLVVT
jgi:formylglycine-generating enzyme required for sulfatase activity